MPSHRASFVRSPPPTEFDPRTHRKLVKHYDIPGQARALTFSCYQRKKLLTDERFCALLSEAIDRAVTRHGFKLVAFVFMPEHVHLIVFSAGDDARVSGLLSAIKRPFSVRVKRLLESTGDPLLRELTIRERPSRTTFRFWQEGGGYDRNITSVVTLRAAIDYVHANPVRRGLCETADAWRWSSWHVYQGKPVDHDLDLPTVHGPSW